MTSRFLLSTVCLVLLAAPLYGAPTLSDRLPGDTLVYIGWAGRSLTFDGSLAGQFVAEPAVAELFAGLQSMAEANLGPQQGPQFAEAWQMAAIAWQHPIAAALLELDAGQAGPIVRGVVLIDLGRDRDAFAGHLDTFIQSLGEQVQFADETVGVVPCRVARGVPGVDEIALGFMGETFFLSFGAQAAATIVALPPTGTLATNATFNERWQAVGGEGEQLSFYVDIAALIPRLERLSGSPAIPTTAPQTQAVSTVRTLMDALGVGKATALASCTRVVDRGMYTRARLFSPAPHQGLLMPLAGGELTEADLVGVPADADFAAALKLSPQAAWTELVRVVGQVDPHAQAQVLSAVAEAENEMGLSIADDILANLGDTIVLSSAASQGGFLTGTVMTVTVKDTAKLAAAMDQLEQYLLTKLPPQEQRKVSIEKTMAGRTEIHYLRGSLGIPWPVAPAWAIYKDKLHVALWPQVISSIVAREGTVSPLTEAQSYKQPRSHLGRSASAICYVNTPGILRQVYHWPLLAWTVGANSMGAAGLMPARPDWLPDLATLEKYLAAEMSSIWADESGITFESYGSMPTGGMALAPTSMSPLAIAILLPSLHRARQLANRSISLTNLRGIGVGVAMYAAENRDRFPTDLAQLVQGQQIPAKLLGSPLAKHEPPQLIEGKLVGEVDYVLLALDASAPPNLLLAYERPELAIDGEVPVLFADLHVATVPVWQLEELIAATQKWQQEHSPSPATGEAF